MFLCIGAGSGAPWRLWYDGGRHALCMILCKNTPSRHNKILLLDKSRAKSYDTLRTSYDTGNVHFSSEYWTLNFHDCSCDLRSNSLSMFNGSLFYPKPCPEINSFHKFRVAAILSGLQFSSHRVKNQKDVNLGSRSRIPPARIRWSVRNEQYL